MTTAPETHPDATPPPGPPAPPPAAPIPPVAPIAATGRTCENCGQPLYGEHCYGCGQWTKGLVRHFSSILGDFFDTVLNIDSRVLRTLWPLFTKPGYLTLEYLAGRRVRYVTPMRLYLFLSIIAFFAMQMSVDIDEEGDPDSGIVKIDDDSGGDTIRRATTPEQVRKALAEAERELATARKEAAGTPGVAGIDIARKAVQESAQQQLDYLAAVEAAKASGKPAPKPPSLNNKGNFNFPVNGKPWDPKTNPVAFSWLPDAANASLNRRMAHARDVLKGSNSEKPVVDALFRVSPQVLFVLMPIFALMLKLAYAFKRRLYMEHLLVALHSHSFISLALTVVIVVVGLQAWLAPNPGFFNGLLGWAMGLTIAWMPVYLLLMQKRVYGQGWPMTLVKYAVLGFSYSVLLGFGLMASLLVGLLTL